MLLFIGGCDWIHSLSSEFADGSFENVSEIGKIFGAPWFIGGWRSCGRSLQSVPAHPRSVSISFFPEIEKIITPQISLMKSRG